MDLLGGLTITVVAGVVVRGYQEGDAGGIVHISRDHGAYTPASRPVVAICDTYIDRPLSIPFWEERMGYTRRAVIFRKELD